MPIEVEPIARVLPMLSVPHLDREFDYLVSAEQSDVRMASQESTESSTTAIGPWRSSPAGRCCWRSSWRQGP